MKLSKVILLSTVCSFGYAADCSYAMYNASGSLSLVSTSGIHTYHTSQHLTDETPALPSAQSGNRHNTAPSLSREGWRKENNPVNCFLTTGESLLTGGLVETTRSQCYKPSDRSGVAELLSEAYEARREGMSSEASITFSSNIEKMSLTGHIPPRELLTRLKSGEFLLPLPQGEDNKLNVFKTASVCFITDTRACSGEKFSNDETPGNGSGNPEMPEYKTPEEICQDAGYGQTPCPEGSSPIPCPVAPQYFACSCAEKFNQICEAPNYGVGESCGGKYEKCEEDLDRACKEENENYVKTCPNGWQMDTKCSFDPSYGLCCNLCKGYTYKDEKDIPDGYVKGETCVNCDNEPWFKLAPNPCDGFYDCSLTAPEIGAKTCLSGTLTKYDKCKHCPNQGNLTSCPTGYKCEYEKCSGKYYKVDGCASGYDWDDYYKTCTEHCDYEATLDTCPENAVCWYESCSGKYQLSYCEESYERHGDECVCPHKCSLRSCPEGGICDEERCSHRYCLTACRGYEDYKLENGTCVCEQPDTLIRSTSYSDCPEGTSCSRKHCSEEYYIQGCYLHEGYRWNESKKTCELFETKTEYREAILSISPCAPVVQGGEHIAAWKIRQVRCPFTGEIRNRGTTNFERFDTQEECEEYRDSHLMGDDEGWEISDSEYPYCTIDGEFKSSKACEGGTWNCMDYNGR